MYSEKHLGCTISDMGLEPFHTYLCNINTSCAPLDFSSSREKLLKRWFWNDKTPQLRMCQKHTSIIWQSERTLGLSSSPTHTCYCFFFTIILEAIKLKWKGWLAEHLLSWSLKDTPWQEHGDLRCLHFFLVGYWFLYWTHLRKGKSLH